MDPLPPLEKNGIFKLRCPEFPAFYIGETRRSFAILRCPECPAFYIGKTGTSFAVRFGEHQVAFVSRLKSRKSAFAEHLIDSDYKLDLDNCKSLHFQSRYRKKVAFEEYEIHKRINLHGELVLNKVVNEQGWEILQ